MRDHCASQRDQGDRPIYLVSKPYSDFQIRSPVNVEVGKEGPGHVEAPNEWLLSKLAPDL